MHKVCRYIEDQCRIRMFHGDDDEDEKHGSSYSENEHSNEEDAREPERGVSPVHPPRKRSRRILDSDDDDDGKDNDPRSGTLQRPLKAMCLDDEESTESPGDDEQEVHMDDDDGGDSFIDDWSLAELSLCGQSHVEDYVTLVSKE